MWDDVKKWFNKNFLGIREWEEAHVGCTTAKEICRRVKANIYVDPQCKPTLSCAKLMWNARYANDREFAIIIKTLCHKINRTAFVEQIGPSWVALGKSDTSERYWFTYFNKYFVVQSYEDIEPTLKLHRINSQTPNSNEAIANGAPITKEK